VIFTFYKFTTDMAGPAIDRILAGRMQRGKEDPARIGERRGIAGHPRPDGPLVWLHGASVGETVALLPLIDLLRDRRPDLAVLVTSGTVTSARAMARRLPDGVIHQFVPVDRSAWVRRFLDHWRPDLAVWMESDLWPNLVLETRARDIPMALVDARMSEASVKGWRKLGRFARPVFQAFDRILAAGAEQAERFRALGGRLVEVSPSLKAAGTPLPADPDAHDALTRAIGDRPAWLAASTHPGEEIAVASVHRQLAERHPGLLTLIAPRHPDRAEEIKALLKDVRVVRRSAGGLPDSGTEIYLCDTLGEMGTLHAAVPVVFVAGSLVPVGGHNPIEAAHAGVALVQGPLNPNNRESSDDLIEAGAMIEVPDGPALFEAISTLLTDPERRREMGEAARRVARAKRAGAQVVYDRLAPLLPPVAGVETPAAESPGSAR